jgi:hypothetical protein
MILRFPFSVFKRAFNQVTSPATLVEALDSIYSQRFQVTA